MKKLITLLFLVLAPASAWAHPLADKARAIQEVAHVLEQRMGSGPEQLTWGQQMALDDMKGLVQAASQASLALQPDLELEQVRTQLSALQLAGNRVRLSTCVAKLDAEGVELSRALVGQIKEVEDALVLERSRLQDRQIAANRPAIGFGMGYGYGFSSWNYGWPYRGIGWIRTGRGRRCR